MTRLRPRLCALLLACALSLPEHALAHRVNIFAWVAPGVIETESSFSTGSAARNCPVEIRETGSGRLLATARTNEQGLASIPVTAGMTACPEGVTLVLRAGEGHQNSWPVSREELLEAAGTAPAGETAPDTAPATGAAARTPGDTAAGQQAAPATGAAAAPAASASPVAAQPAAAQAVPVCTRADMEAAVAEAVRRELAPLRRELVMLQRREPGLREIGGGIGWIVGLAGIGAWWTSRRKAS